MSVFHFEVKDKGRVVLPAALRAECAIDTGTELVARSVAPGCFIVETMDVVLDRIWAGATDSGVEAVVDLERWHTEADAARWERLSSEPADDDGESAARSAAALHALGL